LGQSSANGDSGERSGGRLNAGAPGSDTLSADAAPSTHDSGDAAPSSATVGDIDALTRGTAIGRYVVLEKLGAGAMGVVYAAFDPELDRRIALKLLRPQAQTADRERRQARMVREAKAIARVSHPNVVAIHDVGVHEGQVFMAMEHLPGGTLRWWMAEKKRPWREVVRMFIAIGRGLAGAHAEGLVHRDFKPDNVLLDKNGVPKVVDFGLVRLSATTTELTTTDVFAETVDADVSVIATPAATGPAALTRTGALTGTPAYMAPEQYRNAAVDARTDQFAFCVALYEALYGERPFAGDNIIALADAVISGRVKEAPKDSQVPGWVRRAVLRGLSVDSALRFVDTDALIAVLADDPIARRRRRIGLALAAAASVGALWAINHASAQRKAEFDRQIAERLTAGRTAVEKAHALKESATAARLAAFADFDANHRMDGEEKWSNARSLVSLWDSTLQQAQDAFDAALTMDPRPEVEDQLAHVLYERALVFELDARPRDALSTVARLKTLGPRTHQAAAWSDPGTVELDLDPPDATVVVEEATEVSAGRLIFRPRKEAHPSASGDLTLPPGSYRLVINAPGRVRTLYPIAIVRGMKTTLPLRMPVVADVPKGFVYVAGGDFLDGDSDESSRIRFLNAPPIHRVTGHPFLISRLETTFADWIVFLQSLSPADRKMRAPRLASDRGSVILTPTGPAQWQLELIIGQFKTTARLGEPMTFPGRKLNRSQRWENFPVTGISYDDATAYVAWLRETGSVPGARFCKILEWEHAARGADDRVYPHGYAIFGDDANIDATYVRHVAAFGPDEAGIHRMSDSPFGVSDMAGNAMEIVESSWSDGQLFIMGGGYYHDAKTALLTNREPVDRSLRFHTVGLRVCADVRE
jgi:serine/threonine protein kinase/formylglycine-generating enzyme required for sulfatase activity